LGTGRLSDFVFRLKCSGRGLISIKGWRVFVAFTCEKRAYRVLYLVTLTRFWFYICMFFHT
jgi:hypothetical protein